MWANLLVFCNGAIFPKWDERVGYVIPGKNLPVKNTLLRLNILFDVLPHVWKVIRRVVIAISCEQVNSVSVFVADDSFTVELGLHNKGLAFHCTLDGEYLRGL